MARTARVTRDDIVGAAVELVRARGHEALNARALAAALGCSTQPILYHFSSMDEVRAATYQAVDERHTAYLVASLADAPEPLLQLGLNYVRFAHKEPRLFRFLFQTDAFGGQDLGSLVAAPQAKDLVSLVARSSGMDEEQARHVFLSIFVSAHGYASLLANNALTYDEGQVTRVLTATYYGALQTEGEAS